MRGSVRERGGGLGYVRLARGIVCMDGVSARLAGGRWLLRGGVSVGWLLDKHGRETRGEGCRVEQGGGSGGSSLVWPGWRRDGCCNLLPVAEGVERRRVGKEKGKERTGTETEEEGRGGGRCWPIMVVEAAGCRQC